MKAPVTPEGSLSIDHLHWRCLVDARHPAPDRVRTRVDGAVRNELQPALLEALAHVVDDGSDAVWFIRRLSVRLTADVGAVDIRALAAVWSARVAAALVQLTSGGGDGDNVVRFPSEAEYLASFVTDLAGGRAWDCWWHDGMSGLRALPRSAAIREALVREPARIAPALRLLYRARTLDAIVASLTAVDARFVLEAAIGAATHEAGRATPSALRASVERLIPLVRGGVDHDREALRLAAEALAGSGDADHAAVEGAMLAVAVVREIREGGRGALAEALLSPVMQSQAGGSGAAGRVAELARADAAWAERIATTLGIRTAAPATHTHALLVTQHAGVYLLLSALSALRVEDVFDESDDGAHEAALCRHVILVKCLGAPIAEQAWRDPAVALAAGLDAPPPPDAMRDPARLALWSTQSAGGRLLASAREALAAAGRTPRRVTRDEVVHLSLARAPHLLDAGPVDRMLSVVARAVIRLFTGTLAGFGRSGAPYIARNFLLGAGTVQVGSDGLRVELPRLPLAILLRMAGVDGRELAVPWVPGGRLVLTLPPG